MTWWRLLLVALVTAPASLAEGQPPQGSESFEVVSIRRNTTGGAGGGVLPGGRYNAINQTVLGVILGAYGIPAERIGGGPGWIRSDRFDIVAKAEQEIEGDDLRRLLQALLRERFAFRAHVENRQLPVYELVVERPDRSLGSGVRTSATDCADREAVANARSGSATLVCGGQAASGRLTLRGMSMNALARALAAPAGRPVINRTELAGAFDIDLEWSALVETADHVSVFTAVREQLGLRLVATSSELTVLVIDNVEHPTEN